MPDSIAIIAPSSVPFQIGGAEKFWWGLRDGLARHSGAMTELIKLPAPEADFRQLVSSYRTFSRLDLSHFDMVVSSKYPAWMVNHKNHVLYLQHPLRGLYDTYHFTGLPEMLSNIPAPLRELVGLIRKDRPERCDLEPAFELCERALATKSLSWDYFSFPGPLIRELVHFFDKVAHRGIRSWLAISNTVRQRPDYFPEEADVRVLHHPSDITNYLEAPGEYIFTASRLNPMKRLHLIVEAMRHVKADVPLKIAGTGGEIDHLKTLASNDSRIEFLGHVPDEALPVLYSKAIFVPFVPYDEDYGLITLEAMSSGKPVLTVSDSGGVAEFVENGVTGLCVEPDAASLGKAMQHLLEHPQETLAMGKKARERAAHINWRQNVQIIMAHSAAAAKNSRRRIVICSHFSPNACGAGGERRIYHLSHELAKKFDVTLASFGCQTQKNLQVHENGDFFRELRLPWPEEAILEAQNLQNSTGRSMDDIAIMLHAANYELLRQVLAKQTQNAACVIVSHPYLFPALNGLARDIPVVYDAHNVEADLKQAIFGGARPDLVQKTAEVEKQCLSRANGLLVCSRGDLDRFRALCDMPQCQCRIAANGFDSARLACASPAQRREMRARLAYPQARLAIFTGSGHAPNVAAAAEIMRLAAQIPDIEFLLVGSVSTQEATRAMPRPANAHLVGIVSEEVKDALLRVADVAVNPVTSGSGTNLKIVEYIAAGLPCVTTPFGARGLDADLSVALQIGPLDKFPAMIGRALQTDPPILAQAAAKVAERFSWQKVFQGACELVDALAGGAGNETAD